MDYLVFETNGKVKKAVKAERSSWPLIRETLEKMFPGQTILAPLERPTGPIQVVNTWMSRTRDGRSRFTSIEQWGVQ